MTGATGFRLSPWMAAAGALALVAAGAAGMFVFLDRRDPGPDAPSAGAPAHDAGMSAVAGPGEPVRIVLTAEAVARAGIRTAPVERGRPARSVRVPGVVEPNGYRMVVVTALAGGQVTDVRAELGQRVDTGDLMAEIYSPELAQVQRQYISMRADLEAIRQRVARLERLTTIGAASEQELEGARAEQTRAAADVEGARARLQLLGLAREAVDGLDRADQIDATMPVPATAPGVVTRRMANRGQNVDTSSELFTVVDLSSVWVVGDVYERDLDLIRLGSEVAVTTPSQPEEVWRGRVSYIDPQIAMATRTARVRVEVDNPGERLKLGMFVELVVEERAAAEVPLVPRGAVQTIGSAEVVYVPDPVAAGAFVERVVRLGRPSGDALEVLAGLAPGELVVVSGSFALRAERERLGLPAPVPRPAPDPRGSAAPPAPPARYEVAITEAGLMPATIRIPAGRPAQIVFTRRTENTCGTDVVFPELDIHRDLPLDTPVVVALPPQPAGTLTFACDMGMLRGTIIVVPAGGGR